ncbi:MAG: peptidylprolyl isomerase [Gammaproteobacteria bacterium]|nr:peptidylprolyl isomerase [Gammaproteobacteria bacterium]MDG2339367.1 peptidylprolyl isomerase [Gammaproteobacteria bacterium]
MNQMNKSSSVSTPVYARIMREPIVHFFIIAVIIFALYTITQAGNENLLEIDQREIDARIFMQELSRGEELSAEQRDLVTAYYIEEQILVREALAMELDNDERIHDILAQKMRHVLSGNIIQPSAAELSVYYEQNRTRFETPATADFDELVFDSTGPLEASILTSIQQGAEADALMELSEGTVATLPNVNSVDLANIFDQEFANKVLAAELNQWQGPFISNRGQHWLRATQRNSAGIPALDDIADLVRLEWIAAEEEVRLQQEVDRLWDQYTIVINNSEAE